MTMPLNIFKKSYPFNDDLKFNTRLIFFITIGVFLFMWLFQPFDIGLLSVRERYYLMVGFAVITFFTLVLNLLYIPSLLPKLFASSKWNIQREIFYDLWILFTILMGYFFYTRWLGVMGFDFYTVIKLVLMAAIPLTVLIIFNHQKMLRTHLKMADEFNKKLRDNKQSTDPMIHFKSDYQKDSLSIRVSTLVLIRSANNYIEVFWMDGSTLKNQMVRCSMTLAEMVVKEFKTIYKCHRSYIVNVRFIDRIEGNSLGYKVFCEMLSFPVPVSKNMVDKLRELI
ncbi:LytTr DNA-binding domain-containing protein [Breznakibacter xylanolyticus]|uniref:LytTr DNA-binding domain-containing protein n=2 Tax=Breznakibacter xylanolyticus TaxID=990 RepID=A0A2W7NPG6_9BACT|nr:LytTr DNA-binding domain-containing protein [Breznakibacter xylanolyticus]